ncbi:hypothetical protein [Crateriforma conspicua]|uniref:Uncharacterized protein n=1 Tax=Crateriforma conspicua TaxID=2527996 RepID=A0A5C6FLD0_9PLAN|nr:hypothetical protein [Crateriforma conspicua]TWU62837.1 hypothetical protein V7x_45730 [Crateriforma conspicua]
MSRSPNSVPSDRSRVSDPPGRSVRGNPLTTWLDRRRLVALAAAWIAGNRRLSLGQQSIDSSVAGSSAVVSDTEVRDSVQWLVNWGLDQLPPVYRGDKDWGRVKRVWAGVDMKLDGLKLRTHRKWHDQEHGRWFRYEIFSPGQTDRPAWARDHRPGSRLPVQIEVRSLRQEEKRWWIDVVASAPLDFTAQLQRWNLGVKWYSLTTHGNMQVRIDATMGVDFATDYTELPPALVIAPHVAAAKLTLVSFDLHRVSHVGGEVAEEIGTVVERNLKRFWLDKLNEKLADKLNRSIDKHRDDLRFSLADYWKRWTP